MNKKKTLIAIAAIVVASQIGSMSIASVPSIENMRELQGYIVADDYDALHAFLIEHPELLDAKGPLAENLRAFMAQRQSFLEFVGFISPKIPQALKTAATVPNSIY